MAFQAGDLFTGIQALLMGRTINATTMLEAIRKTVLEFTEDYKHPLLETNGPNVNLVPFQNMYSPDFFLAIADAGLDLSKVASFFIYNDGYTQPSLTSSLTNAGYNLKYRSMDSIEVLWNIPGLPQYWGRHNNMIAIASMPDQAYTVYMRYQNEHPQANVVNGFTSATQIQMADTWQEVVEYGAAQRLAQTLNISGKTTELNTRLYGDAKFQQSNGIEGAPGLIFQRTSQRNRDQQTTTRRMRIRMGGS